MITPTRQTPSSKSFLTTSKLALHLKDGDEGSKARSSLRQWIRFLEAWGIFLPCQIIWTGCACLVSLLASSLYIFTQHSRWHLVMVFHPNEFALVNAFSTEMLKKLGV